MSLPLDADGNLLLKGAGNLFLERIEAAGTARGLHFCGQVTKIEGSLNDEKLTERSACTRSAAPIKEVLLRRTPKIAATFKTFDVDNLALITMGVAAKYTQAATAITNEVHADVKLGKYVKLLKRGPISSVTVEPSGGGTAFTLGTDYEITDSTIPLIKILSTGTIADGGDIQVDYTPTAITAPNGLDLIRLATQSVIECKLFFFPDPVSGPGYQLEIPKVSVNPTGIFGLIQSGDEFGSADMDFTIISDSTGFDGSNSPYGNLLKVA